MQPALAWGSWTRALGEPGLLQWCGRTCCRLWLPWQSWERTVSEEWQYSELAPSNLDSIELACILTHYMENFTHPFSFCLCNSLQKQTPDFLQGGDSMCQPLNWKKMYCVWGNVWTLRFKAFPIARDTTTFCSACLEWLARPDLECGGDHIVLGKEEG